MHYWSLLGFGYCEFQLDVVSVGEEVCEFCYVHDFLFVKGDCASFCWGDGDDHELCVGCERARVEVVVAVGFGELGALEHC